MRRLLAAVGATAFLAGAPIPGVRAGPLAGTERVVLENGLTVLLLPEPGTGLVSVGAMYRVGAKNEAAGTTGLAHYAEHMCFRATKRFPGHEITESVTRRGGRWTGYTWIDQTFYQTTVSKEHLGLALDLEADRMGDALYDEEEFEKERASVVAELRSYDSPHSLLYDEVLLAAFQIHPYRNNTIGWLTDVESVSRAEAYRFYRRYYHPRNAVLALGGDFEPGAALAAVRARFASKAAGDDAHVSTLEPPPSGERRVVVRKPGPQAEVLLAFRAPALEDPEFPALVLFDALLAGGKGLRFLTDYEPAGQPPLTLSLVASGIARETRSAFQASLQPYVYTLKAVTAEASGLAAAEQALFGTVQEAAGREWTDDDLRRARREVRAGLALDLDTLAGRVHQLAFFEVSGGFEHLRDLEPRLELVTAEEARRFARERLTRNGATVGWFVPTPGVPAFTGGQAQRPPLVSGPGEDPAAPAASPPAGGSPRARVPAPSTARFRLANGLALAVSPRSATGLVALRGRIDAGAIHDVKEGTSVLAGHLFALSAEERGAPPIVLALSRNPSGAVHARFLEFEATAPAEDLPGLARAVARGFRLDPSRLESARQAALEVAASAAAGPAARLTARARDALFGTGSALGRTPWGDPAALSARTADEVAAFARSFLSPARTELSVAGPVSADAVQDAFENAFAETSTRAARAPVRPARLASPPAPRGPAAWTVVHVPQRDAAQNTVHVVLPGDRSRPYDGAATAALLYLLGETYYSGRLGRALVEPGLVYSVSVTREEAPGLPGYLLVRTATAKENTLEVLRRIRGVLEEAARGAFVSTELEEAKAYLRGKAVRRRDGALSTADAALELTPPGPAPDALTLAQLNDTARRLFAQGAPLALVGGPGE